MREAMEYRAVIEQAEGIVMADRHCSEGEAFDILRRASNDTNRKMRELAEMLVTEASRKPRPAPSKPTGTRTPSPGDPAGPQN